MKLITACMPQLEVIEMGYNQLLRLAADKPSTSYNTTVHSLNLDTNVISDWAHICASLKEYQAYVAASLSLTFLIIIIIMCQVCSALF
jgi:hypothetical protein